MPFRGRLLSFSIARRTLAALALSAACLGIVSARATAASWTTTTPLPEAYDGHALVYSSNRLIHTGGISYNGGILDGVKVFSAAASDAGTVGAWTPGPSLPEAVYYHASAAVNGFIYVLGGFHYTDAAGIVVSNVVYRAKVNPDGSVGAWQADTVLPQPVFFPSAAAWNGRIYVTGGWNGTALVSAVYSAEVKADGGLGPWIAQKALPQAVYTHAAVSNGTLYVLGGTVNGGNDIQNSVYFAKINADGSLADWAAASPLPAPVSNHGAVVANGRVFVLGGWTGAAPTAAVHSSLIAAGGGLGGWAPEALLPRPLYLLASAASASHIFVSGGIDDMAIRNEVYSLPLPPPPPPADSLPPRTSLAFSGPLFGGVPFISTATAASLSAVDDAKVVGDGAGVGVAGTQWALDDGVFAAYTAPIRVPSDGGHWIRFMSVDTLGHAETVRASSAAVDGTAPVSALSVGAPRAVLATGEVIVGPATRIAVTAVDPVVNGAASGVARTLAGVDGGALAASTEPFVLPAVDGAHAVLTQAVDNVGNAEAAHAATVHRDAAPPLTTLTLSSPAYAAADGAPYLGAGTLLNFSAQDPAGSGGVAAGVNRTEYSLGGAAAEIYSGPFGLAEGAHTVSYRSLDNVANAEAWRTASYRSDLALPQSTLTWEGAPRAPTTETAFSLAALDPASSGVASGVRAILYSVDGGPDQAYARPFHLPLGRHDVRYAAVDNAGNLEPRNAATVVVAAADALPPRTALAFGLPLHGSVPFISPATPATLIAVDDARVIGDAAGAGVGSTLWALDGGSFTAYTAPIHVSGDGSRWIRYLSVDALGNAEAVRASSAAVDGTPPASTLSAGAPQTVLAGGQLIVGPNTLLAVSAEDPVVNGVASGVARVLVGVDGAAPAPAAGPFALPASDGAHAVSMQASDHVGNTEASRAVAVYRDGAPPVTTLAFAPAPYAGPSGPILGAAAALSFAAVDPVSGGIAAGVHHTEYRLDGGSATVYAGAFGAAEGAHALSYRSVDGVGNAEAARSVSFFVDATAPRTTLSLSGGAALFGEDMITPDSAVSLAAEDPVSAGASSGVERIVYSVDGGADSVYGAPFRLPAGRHTVSYGAVDRAGNAEPRSAAALSVGAFLTDALAATGKIELSGKAGVVGAVRTNAAFTADGKSFVDGDVAGLTVTLSGRSTVSGAITRGQAAVVAPSYDLDAARAWAMARNNNAALPSRLLRRGALILEDRDSAVLPAGDYYFTELRLRGKSSVSVSGRVNIFLDGPLTVRGGSSLNGSGDAGSLWIVSADESRRAYERSGDDDERDEEDDEEDRREHDYGVFLNGKSRAAFNLYAPLAAVRALGKGQFAGRVLAKTVSLSGKTLQPSTTALTPSKRAPKPSKSVPPLAAREDGGTRGRGHADGREDPVASSDLEERAPLVAARAPAAAPAPALVDLPRPGPALAPPPRADAPREVVRLAPAAPRSGAGTAGPGRSGEREAAVASSRLEREEPRREPAGGAVLPPIPDRAGAASAVRVRGSRLAPSRMPSFPLAARAAFAAVGREANAVRAKDRSAVVIPEGAATAGLGVTVSPPKKSDVVENRRQAAVEARKGLVAASLGVQYGPEGTHFAKPVTLELPYDRAALPAGVLEKDLFVHYWNPVKGDWEKLESSVDTRDQIVRAQTTHFSLYQVFAGGSAASTPSSPNDPTFAVHAAYAFPNPSRNGAPVVVRVQPGLADSVSVRVYDLSGRLVHESSSFQNRGGVDVNDGSGFGSQFTFEHIWDVSGVGSGVYNFVITGHKAGAGDISATGKVGVIK